jgi:hypothetical protein
MVRQLQSSSSPEINEYVLEETLNLIQRVVVGVYICYKTSSALGNYAHTCLQEEYPKVEDCIHAISNCTLSSP